MKKIKSIQSGSSVRTNYRRNHNLRQLIKSIRSRNSKSFQQSLDQESDFIDVNVLSEESIDNGQQFVNRKSDFNDVNSLIKFSEDKYVQKLFELSNKHNPSNLFMDDIIKLMNDLVLDVKKDKDLEIVKSFHLLKNEIGLNVDKFYGFRTECCDLNIIQKKDENNSFKCLKCHKIIKSSDLFKLKNYFYYYDLEQIITIYLNKFDLISYEFSPDEKIKNYYDACSFQSLYRLKGNSLITIKAYTDGVKLNNSDIEPVWPLTVKLNEVNCDMDQKNFTIGAYYEHPGNLYHCKFKKVI